MKDYTLFNVSLTPHCTVKNVPYQALLVNPHACLVTWLPQAASLLPFSWLSCPVYLPDELLLLTAFPTLEKIVCLVEKNLKYWIYPKFYVRLHFEALWFSEIYVWFKAFPDWLIFSNFFFLFKVIPSKIINRTRTQILVKFFYPFAIHYM